MMLTSTQIGELAAQFFIAGVGTLCFAVLFACPRKSLFFCGLVGAVGWFVYELAVMLGADSAAASLLAVIPLTLLTRVFAITLKMPVTVFLLSGIFPLVPGAGIYYTAYYFIQGNNALALSNGISTFNRHLALLDASSPERGGSFFAPNRQMLKIPPSGELANAVSLRGFIRSLGEAGKAAGFDGRGCPLPKKRWN